MTRFAQKIRIFLVKSRTNECYQTIHDISIRLRTKFDCKTEVLILFNQICPKEIFCGQKHTNEHCHQFWHIQVNLARNFHLKEKMLIFWTKFDQEEYLKQAK